MHYGGIKNSKNKYNYGTYMKYAINELNKKYEKYKKEINIKYETEKEDIQNIFGEKFVENNKNNIEIEINGKKSKLKERYKLIKAVNNIKMIIKK